ncbi:MAG TPA: BON domain-containing protein [Rhodocyclaceae bacterium]
MEGKEEIIRRIHAAVEHEAGIGMQGSGPIAMDWRDGALVLTGEVRDVRTKKLAAGAAAAAAGDTPVVDRLRVDAGPLMGDGATRDAVCRWLLRDIDFQNCGIFARIKNQREVLREAGPNPSGAVEVGVEDGVVTLSGYVISLSHKRLAGVLAWWARGCRDVVNELEIAPAEEDNDEEIAEALKLVLESDPYVHADQIGVGARDRVVTLQGLVWTEGERERAERDAWCLFDVDKVINKLEVLAA